MRQHCNWMVLVAIVWTILHDVSAQETIPSVSSVRGFEKRKSFERYEEKSNEHSRRNDSTMDDDRSEVQDNATVSSRDDAKQPIDKDADTIKKARTIEANNRHSQESTQIHGGISAPQSIIETNNGYLKAAGNHRYTNYDADPLQLLVHGTLGRLSTTDNVTAPRIASDEPSPVKHYIFPKVHDAVGANFDIDTVRSNETKHVAFEHTDRDSKLARASENSARLITNSNASSTNHRTPDLSLGTRSDESEPMTKYSHGETQSMVSSSRYIDSAGERRSRRKAVRSSSNSGSSKDDRLSWPNRRTNPVGSSLANIAFGKNGERNKRKNKRLPLTTRRPMDVSLSLQERKDTRSVASQRAEWTVVDETVTTSLSYPERETSVLNKFDKIIPLIGKQIVEEPPEKDRALVGDVAHSGTVSSSTGPEYLSQRKAHRVTIPSRNEREGTEFVTTGSTNNINLLPIANDIPRALFEEGSVRNSELSDTGTYNAEMGISTGNPEENFQHTNILKENRMKSSLRPSRMKMVDGQRQKIREINYPERTNTDAISYLASLPGIQLSEMKGEKVTVARRNKVAENEVSERGRAGGTGTNEEVWMPHPSTGSKRVSGGEEFVDNAANPDSTRDNRIHRSVVKIALTGFHTERRSHKSLIGRDSTGGINLRRDQTQNHVQGRREQVLKFFSEIDSPEIERSRVSEDEASESTTLENSNTFSSSNVVQPETDVLESSVAPRRTRKMEFSKIDPVDNRAPRRKNTGHDGAIPSRGPPEVSQASLPVDAEDRGIGVVEKTLANMIGKIYWHVGSETPPSIGSPFPELLPEDHGPVKGEHDCNGDGVTTERQRHDESFIQNCQEDRSGTESPGSQSKSRDRALDRQLAVSTRFASILPKDKPAINDITGVTRPFALVDETNREDKRVPMKYEFFGQTNYKRKLKIDEGNSATAVNTSKLRDSTMVVEGSSKIGVEPSNDNDGKMVDVKLCETCKIVGVAENTSVGREGDAVDAGNERRSEENDDRDTKENESKIGSTIRSKIPRTNEIPVDPVLTVGYEPSLAPASAEFKVIDHSRREARVGEQLQQEDGELLVRGQEPVFIAPKRENSIRSRAQLTERSLGSGELKAHDDAISSGLSLDRRNENNENGSYSHLHAETQQRYFYFPAKKKAYAEHTRGPLIPRSRESFMFSRNLSFEFSNNALTSPRGPENSNVYATVQTASTSTSPRRRKSLFHNAPTAGSSSSSKTDSVLWSIGSTSDDDRYSMREELPKVSQSGVPRVSPVHGKLADDAAEEQIKRGFPMEDSLTFYVTEPTTGRYSEYVSSATVPSPEVRDVKPTDNIIRTIEGNTGESQPSSTDLPIIETGTLSNHDGALSPESMPMPVSNKSNVKQVSGKEFQEKKSPRFGNGGSANLQRPQTGEPRENVRIDLRTGDMQSLNHTDRDNSTRITATLNQWPVKHSAVVEGDLLLGGLMMVHEREDSITCGPVMPQGGVQALEAMLYTLDWLNERDLVPGVKIGAHILDDCDKDTYGLEMAVDFIKGSISNIDGAEYHCNKTAVRKVISGVVGAASSVTSIQVANLLRLFRIPQVSFFSTSPELSNKMRFEYFTRTIPSDHYQVKAMVDIVLGMGWSYVSIIYEESNYGEKAYEELEKLLGKHQICIAVKEKLSKDSGVAEAHVYDNIVLKLLTKPRARGCIIFASDQEVAGVMKAVRRCNATGAFSWIGSDGWSARSLVSDGNEPEMEGTLSVQPQANPVEGFEDYFLNLTVENNRRNPWFVEFWEDHFKCRYPNASQTPYNNYSVECTTTERLTKQNTAFEDQLQFVSDAVLAFAYAFREMHKDLCRGTRGLCESMKPTKGTELLNYLRKVEFMGLSGDVFHFDKNGDGPARYNIIHFKQVSPGKYKWIRVGEYLEGELRLNMSEIQFRLGHPEPPESVCSLPCEVGQAKKYVEGESCCWHCFNCTQYQVRHHTDEKQCSLCPQGTVPDETHSYCRDIPEEFLRPESGWAIGAMSFSSTGILITLFVGGVFLKHNDTPIVRASGRELSYVLLTGILLCYLVTFALVLRPNDFVCSIQRFSAGFCFTVVYAALLTKTNRISRIFNAGKRSAKRPSFISPRSQLIICSMLIAVQILINGVWMVIDPAKAMHHYPTREDNLLVCNSYIDASYMIAFTYPIILIVVCTVYAVLTRKIPEAFNESKHIGFTMYTTCVIWLAFVPLYFATGSHVALRITSMSVTISLSASVTIACLFTPKLYIILIHPERNVRPNMMQNRYNTTKGSVATATNASSMLAPVTLTAVTCDQNKTVKKHVITTIDCSTQIEQYEMELKDQKNGKFTPAVVTRETQTLLNNNGKESSAVTSPTIKDTRTDENIISSRGLNVGKIANGPMNQNEVPL